MAAQKLLHLSGGGKLLKYDDFTTIPLKYLMYGNNGDNNTYYFSSSGNNNTFNCNQYQYHLLKFYVDGLSSNQTYYGLINNTSGNKIVKENESIILTSPDYMDGTGFSIKNTDFAALIANYIRAKYDINSSVFTYDDAIYSLEEEVANSGSQDSITFFVEYCGTNSMHNGSFLMDIGNAGRDGATYDDWDNEIIGSIVDAIDWEYTQYIPAVTSTFAESNAREAGGYLYNSNHQLKTITAYRNISLVNQSLANYPVPEVYTILILAPLYVTGIRIAWMADNGILNGTFELTKIYTFEFCNVFIAFYDDLTCIYQGKTYPQEFAIEAYKINITAKRRNNGYIYGSNRSIQINDWLYI